MFFFFFFNDTATTEIYTLSLHDALPIYGPGRVRLRRWPGGPAGRGHPARRPGDPRRGHRPVQPAVLHRRGGIGRAHGLTPITPKFRMPSFSLKKKKKNKQ